MVTMVFALSGHIAVWLGTVTVTWLGCRAANFAATLDIFPNLTSTKTHEQRYESPN